MSNSTPREISPHELELRAKKEKQSNIKKQKELESALRKKQLTMKKSKISIQTKWIYIERLNSKDKNGNVLLIFYSNSIKKDLKLPQFVHLNYKIKKGPTKSN